MLRPNLGSGTTRPGAEYQWVHHRKVDEPTDRITALAKLHVAIDDPAIPFEHIVGSCRKTNDDDWPPVQLDPIAVTFDRPVRPHFELVPRSSWFFEMS